MSEATTLARPYARAVFELARDSGDYQSWSDALANAAAVVRDARVMALLQSPQRSNAQGAELVLSIVGDKLSSAASNFIEVLASNDRLELLPTIAPLYETYRAEAESTIEARVVVAQAIDEAKLKAIGDSLAKRLGRKVSLLSEVKAELIGGAIVYAGDLVIDGSVRGKLRKLSSTLVN